MSSTLTAVSCTCTLLLPWFMPYLIVPIQCVDNIIYSAGESRDVTLDEMFALLDKRRPGFEMLWDKVKTTEHPLIVETGCTRQPDNWFGDGQSTQVFNAMCEQAEGTLNSVDINQENCAFARQLVGPRAQIYCGDSVEWLQQAEEVFWRTGRKITVLYLDSFDLDVNNWAPSALHHIFELLSIKNALAPGSLVAVDDNVAMEDGTHVGKGTFVANWMQRAGKQQIHQGYQWIWQW